MKQSKYNHIIEHKGTYYLYNILSTAIVELDNRCLEILKKCDFEQFSKEEREMLYRNHIIIEDDLDEAEEFLYHYNSIRFSRNAKILTLIFIPTYNCNLACPYCIQGGNKPLAKMSRDQIDAVIKFARTQVKQHSAKQINCILFGGEPMMVKSDIVYISDNINEIANEYNCATNFSITSNFTLLDDSMIDLIRKYNMIVQVSIDGIKQEHDKRRITHSKKGTYDIILNNLKKMKEKGLKDNINLRLNVDVDNLNDAKDMLENVKDFAGQLYFGFLTFNKGKNDSFETSCVEECDYSNINVSVFDKLLRDNGIEVPHHFGKESPCSLNSEMKFIVDYKLDVYKCELFIGREEAKVGKIDLNGNFIPNGNFYHQMNHSPIKHKECVECKMLPLCASGCVAKTNIAKGKNINILTEKNCMMTENDLNIYLKDYIDNSIS
ncbi:MAG: radical SAM protein [Paludibacteraceae bacterium]|nr:radical SAM protein [Paludibacteraceae bacterium]